MLSTSAGPPHHQSASTRRAGVWVAALALAALGPRAAAAQPPGWGGVAEWEGRIEAFETGAVSGDPTGVMVAFSRSVEKRSVARFTLRRDRDRTDAASGIFAWTGGGEITADNVIRHHERDRRGRGLAITTRSSGTVPATDFSLYIDTAQGFIAFGYGAEAGLWTETTTGEYFNEEKDQATGNFHVRGVSAAATGETNQWAHAPFELEYPLPSGVPGVLSFAAEQTLGDSGSLVPELTQRGRLTLWPVFADVEVEVTIEGYEAWRPLGSIANPRTPGNQLAATATLQPKGNRAAGDLPKVARFRFQLLQTSREPGVCLNWPLGAEDRDPDLRLALAATPGVLGEEDQELTADDPPADRDGRPFATARIDAFDFGAHAELRVIAELEDGREVLGLIRTPEGGRAIVRLPADPTGGRIARSWRQRHRAESLTEDDDEENDPAGNGFKGDGFTLYEEYRGFAVNRRHVTGDPGRKDFFVLNLIGSDAWPGIHRFEQASGLRVHHRLRRDEMSEEDRVMNANHRDGPHRVDQHGVVIKIVTEEELGNTGARVFAVRSIGRLKPANTEKIGILARDDPRSDFNRPFNLPPGDAATSYDSVIAHELAHTVGVSHHGHNDPAGQVQFSFFFADDPRNQTGQPAFLWATAKASLLVDLLDEATSKSVPARLAPVFEAQRARLRATHRKRFLYEYEAGVANGTISTAEFPDAERWADLRINDSVTVSFILGAQHGQHSGDESCVMRYSFAQIYSAAGLQTVYYLIPPGTDQVGRQLCRSRDGRRFNAPDHEPQSRFGAATVGDCTGQLNVNDAQPTLP